MVAELRRGQRALRRPHRHGRIAGRDGMGARLPVASRAGDAARAAARPAHRLLPAHPAPAAGAVHAAAMAPADRRGHAGSRPRGLPAPRRGAELHADRAPARRRHPRARADPLPRSHGESGCIPGLDRLRGVRRHREAARDCACGGRAPARPRFAAPHPARRRPARLHQGHRRAPAGVPRAARERRHARRRDRARPGRDAEPRARGHLPPVARTGRARGGTHQRRVRAPRASRDPLPAPQPPARGPVRPLRGRRCDARDPAARRHEPRLQGVRGEPPPRRGRARALRVRGRRGRAAAGAAREPPRRGGHARDHRARDLHRFARTFIEALTERSA